MFSFVKQCMPLSVANPRVHQSLGSWRVLAAFALCFVMSSPEAAALTFSDGDFFNPDWSTVKILDQTSSQSGTVTAFRVLVGGNPQAYRHVIHDWVGPGSVTFAHIKAGAVYNPSIQGPIVSLSFHFDLRAFNAAAVAYLALIRQNGSYYLGVYNLAVADAWTRFDNTCITAAEFFKYGDFGSGGPTPDFTSTGSLIEFGFATSNGSGQPGPSHTENGIDNWFVTDACPTTVQPLTWGALKSVYR